MGARPGIFGILDDSKWFAGNPNMFLWANIFEFASSSCFDVLQDPEKLLNSILKRLDFSRRPIEVRKLNFLNCSI